MMMCWMPLALPSWPLLRTLNLSDCYLEVKGGIALATALNKGHNSKLSILRLQHDEFNGRTIDLLAQAIADGHLTNLATLEINGNKAHAKDPEDDDDEDDESIKNLRAALEGHGNDDVLDELDEMDEDEEEEEHPAVADAEAQAKEDEEKAAVKTGVTQATAADATDALAELLGRVSIGSNGDA